MQIALATPATGNQPQAVGRRDKPRLIFRRMGHPPLPTWAVKTKKKGSDGVSLPFGMCG